LVEEEDNEGSKL